MIGDGPAGAGQDRGSPACLSPRNEKAAVHRPIGFQGNVSRATSPAILTVAFDLGYFPSWSPAASRSARSC
jgi:hypothetical protein